jgi:hypothetical protein
VDLLSGGDRLAGNCIRTDVTNHAVCAVREPALCSNLGFRCHVDIFISVIMHDANEASMRAVQRATHSACDSGVELELRRANTA